MGHNNTLMNNVCGVVQDPSVSVSFQCYQKEQPNLYKLYFCVFFKICF